jgi:hypothetical protein
MYVYQAIAASSEKYLKPWLNIAALHHKHGRVSDAIRCYHTVLDIAKEEGQIQMLIMTHNNLGIAHNQNGKISDSIYHHQMSMEYIHQLAASASADQGTGTLPMQQASEITDINGHIHRARRSVCDWLSWEESICQLVHGMDTYGSSALLPFDTLALPVAPEWKLKVARQHSSKFDRLYSKMPLDSNFMEGQRQYADGSPVHGTVCSDFQSEVGYSCKGSKTEQYTPPPISRACFLVNRLCSFFVCHAT